MDIASKKGYPSSTLSNFAPHPFIIDDIECNSMEGFLQSLKFDKPHIQKEVCKLVGLKAKYRGKSRNKAWKSVQKLWWLGKEYDRHGKEYQELLDKAFTSLLKNDKFRKALKSTGDSQLTHKIGGHNESETILTKSEFVYRLMKMRELI